MELKSYNIHGITFTQGVMTPMQQVDLLKIFNKENMVINLLKSINILIDKINNNKIETAKRQAENLNESEDGNIEWRDLYDERLMDAKNIIDLIVEYIPQLGDNVESILYRTAAIVLNPTSEKFYNAESQFPEIERINHINKNITAIENYLKAYLDDDTMELIIRDFFLFVKNSKNLNWILGLISRQNFKQIVNKNA